MAAGRHPQGLNDAAGRRFVAVACRMGNSQAHGLPVLESCYIIEPERSSCPDKSAKRVLAPDVPGIHVVLNRSSSSKTWMAGHSRPKDGTRLCPAMTVFKSDIAW